MSFLPFSKKNKSSPTWLTAEKSITLFDGKQKMLSTKTLSRKDISSSTKVQQATFLRSQLHPLTFYWLSTCKAVWHHLHLYSVLNLSHWDLVWSWEDVGNLLHISPIWVRFCQTLTFFDHLKNAQQGSSQTAQSELCRTKSKAFTWTHRAVQFNDSGFA